MTKISDPELEKEFIIHELQEERIAWLGALVDHRSGEEKASYRRIDALLYELYDVNKVLGIAVLTDRSGISELGQAVLRNGKS